MAAATQDRNRKSQRGTPQYTSRLAIKTSSRIYRGTMVNRLNAGGRAVAASAATGRRIAGVAIHFEGGTVNTGLGVAGGTEFVTVESGRLYLADVKTAIRTTTSLGLNVFVADDQMVGGTAVGTAAARIVAGRLIEFEASDKSTAWVHIGVFGPTNIAV